MSKHLSKIIIFLILSSCGKSNDTNIELFVSGAQIAGVNGMHFGPDGLLYAASVIGSDISIIDTKTNKKFIAIKINNKSIFYYDDKKLHESFDQEFNELFFNIWLRSNSKNPNFTKTLLGQ